MSIVTIEFGYLIRDLLFFAVIGFSFSIGAIFVKKGIQSEGRLVLFSYGAFFSSFALARAFFLISDWYQDVRAPDPAGDVIEQAFPFLKAAYISGFAGMAILLAIQERFLIKKTKFLFSLIGCGIVIVTFWIIAYEDMQLMGYIFFSISSLLVIGLFIWLAWISSGTIRRKAIGMMIGVLLVFVSSAFDTELAMSIVPILDSDPHYVWIPITMIAGLALFAYNAEQ